MVSKVCIPTRERGNEKNSFNISIITKIEFLGWSEFAATPKLYQ